MIKNANYVKGSLLLNESSVKIYGGHVDKLVAAWKASQSHKTKYRWERNDMLFFAEIIKSCPS
jgi:hypothetical protein